MIADRTKKGLVLDQIPADERESMGRYRKDNSPELTEQLDDGQELWEKVAQTVKKLNPQSAIQPAKRKTKSKTEPKAETETNNPKYVQPVPVKAQKVSVETKPADFRLGETSGIDRSTARRLQRGHMQIEDRLDLHGLSQEQAHKELVGFIFQAFQKNFRHVLIITGKGRQGHGILRQQVPIWLKDPPLCQHINAISYAQPQDGGTGALYIRLKRQRGEVK